MISNHKIIYLTIVPEQIMQHFAKERCQEESQGRHEASQNAPIVQHIPVVRLKIQSHCRRVIAESEETENLI